MERNEQLIENFRLLIQEETISAQINESNEKFDSFHELLKKVFPNVFKTLEIENFDNSLLLKWKGLDSSKPILFMNHHDVVPAPGNWTYPPFGAEIHDGKMYGRGTLDTKGGLFSMLTACEELIIEGYTPNVDTYFVSTCTEETDGRGGYLIAKTLKERGIKFDFVLDEGGMIMYDPLGGCDKVFGVVGVGEKCYTDIKFIAKSNGGHASTPSKTSPISRLASFVNEVDHSKIFKAKMIKPVEEMFRRMGKYCKGVNKVLLSHPKFFKPLINMIVPNISSTANAMFRTTCAFTMMEGSSAYNVLPDSAYIIANLRFSHHQGKKNSIEAISKIAKKYDLEMEIVDPGYESPITDFNDKGFKYIEECTKAVYEDIEISPYIANGASDSRYFSLVSDNIYRFVPFLIDKKQLASIHGLDESVDIDTIPKAIEVYKLLMKKF